MTEKRRLKNLARLDTIFFNEEIAPIIDEIRHDEDFLNMNLEDIAGSKKVKKLKKPLASDTTIAEQILYYGIGKALIDLFYPRGFEFYYETQWNIKGKSIEKTGKSPFKRFVYDYELQNPKKYPVMNKFIPENVSEENIEETLESAINVIVPKSDKDSRIDQIRLRLKSPGSLAFKITNLLFGHIDQDIYDRLGCKIICPDTKTCYRVLKQIEQGECKSVEISDPAERNIEDAIKNPRKDGFKLIYVNAIHHPISEGPVYFRMHIEPVSTFKLEKREDLEIGHSQYKKKAKEKADEKWEQNEKRFSRALKEAFKKDKKVEVD